MLKQAERLGLRLLSGKPTVKRDPASAAHWARLHERGDKREPLFFNDRRRSHFDLPMAPVSRKAAANA